MTDLVQQLGGRNVLDQVVEDFYVRVQNDPLLSPIFATVDIDHLVAMQREFLAAALEGHGERSGTWLRDAHAGRGITPRHFSRFVELFVEALEDHDVGREVVQAVTGHLSLYADDVVGSAVESG
jgi:hemoglobin